MPISLIGGADSSTATPLQSTALGQEDFLKVLLTQLTFQDPLKPLDNQQFIAQMAQFSTLEVTNQLNDRLDQLLTVQGSTQSLGLLGKTVEITTSSGATQVGEVTTITFNQGQPLLTVRTATGAFLANVDVSQVSLVR